MGEKIQIGPGDFEGLDVVGFRKTSFSIVFENNQQVYVFKKKNPISQNRSNVETV